MKSPLRVLFLGNHTVGVTVLEVIGAHADLVGVVAHPPDEEDGRVYRSVYDWAVAQGVEAIRGRGRDSGVLEFVRRVAPDLIWITDYRYILPPEVISTAPRGAVNLHPSLLPRYRGRASLNWAIINGESETGLTAHFVDDGVDTGDIIDQIRVAIEPDEDVGDVLEKLYPVYRELAGRVLARFADDNVPRTPQDPDAHPAWPARKPADGRIDWRADARTVVDLIRAVAPPYPGAFTHTDGRMITVSKAQVVESEDSGGEAGVVERVEAAGPVVRCGRGAVLLTRYEAADGTQIKLKPGDRLV